jgi:hypothetical protein
MSDFIIAILLFTCIGLVALPAIVLLLAKFGHFEPVSFTLFRKKWHFAPKVKVVVTMGRGTQTYKQDSWVMAGAVSTVLFVLPPANYSAFSAVRPQASQTLTFSIAAIRELRASA